MNTNIDIDMNRNKDMNTNTNTSTNCNKVFIDFTFHRVSCHLIAFCRNTTILVSILHHNHHRHI